MSSRTSSAWRPGVPLPRPENNSTGEPDILDNPAAGRVTKVANLAKRSVRNKYARFLAEGPQSVREAVHHAPEHIHDLYVTPAATSRYAAIVNQARSAGLHVHRVTDEVMRAMSADAQGILAVVATEALEAGKSGEDAQLRDILATASLVVILAETQDPGNAGTIIRAADAAGADAVILARGSVDPTNPKVVRSAAGSLFHLPTYAGLEVTEAIDMAHEGGLTILAADAGGQAPLFTSDEILRTRSAWLMGNEAHGFNPEVLAHADHTVSIPIYGAAESLNVATAAAICLYASARAQRA